MQSQPGDHIYCARKKGLYDHHGIYVGNDRVIHLAGPATTQSVSPECQNCGYQGKGGLVKTCLNCFHDGQSLGIYEYGVPSSDYDKKPRGTCSMLNSRPAHEVIQTATDLLERGGFGEYDAFTNNCEDFAVYCKTGIALSGQVVGGVEKCFRVGFPSSAAVFSVGTVAGAVPVVLGGWLGSLVSMGVGAVYGIRKDITNARRSRRLSR